jgi:hypothetical protein
MGLFNHPGKDFNYAVAYDGPCCGCGSAPPELVYLGYADDDAACFLCRACALQLARKILEDLCDLFGNRYG